MIKEVLRVVMFFEKFSTIFKDMDMRKTGILFGCFITFPGPLYSYHKPVRRS